jgi:hypothetical protein
MSSKRFEKSPLTGNALDLCWVIADSHQEFWSLAVLCDDGNVNILENNGEAHVYKAYDTPIRTGRVTWTRFTIATAGGPLVKWWNCSNLGKMIVCSLSNSQSNFHVNQELFS